MLKGDVRIKEVVSPPDEHGVYEATVEMKKPDGEWVTKTNYRGEQQTNTMFPKDWSEAKIKAEVDSAWANRTDVDGQPNMWEGESTSGVTIQGYKEPRTTAYPVYKKK